MSHLILQLQSGTIESDAGLEYHGPHRNMNVLVFLHLPLVLGNNIPLLRDALLISLSNTPIPLDPVTNKTTSKWQPHPSMPQTLCQSVTALAAHESTRPLKRPGTPEFPSKANKLVVSPQNTCTWPISLYFPSTTPLKQSLSRKMKSGNKDN